MCDAKALTRLALTGNPLEETLYWHHPEDEDLYMLVLVKATELIISSFPRLVKLELTGVGRCTRQHLQAAVPQLAAAREAGRRASAASGP